MAVQIVWKIRSHGDGALPIPSPVMHGRTRHVCSSRLVEALLINDSLGRINRAQIETWRSRRASSNPSLNCA